MKKRFRLIHRGERGGQFYCVDSETGQRFSLKTKDRDAAEQIVLAKNQALRQPTLNLQIAKAYLAGTDIWQLPESRYPEMHPREENQPRIDLTTSHGRHAAGRQPIQFGSATPQQAPVISARPQIASEPRHLP